MKKKNKILTKEYYNLHNFLYNIGIFSFFILMIVTCFSKAIYNIKIPIGLLLLTTLFFLVITFRKLTLGENYKIYQAIKEKENSEPTPAGDSVPPPPEA